MIDLAQASTELLERLNNTEERIVLGVAGAPGAGKSTAAAVVLAAAADAGVPAVVVGMDGWHLAHDVLVARGQDSIKGAPETFDVHGFVDTVSRIAKQRRGDPPIWVPQFRREIEDAVAGAIEVRGEHRLVLVEGNYVLLRESPWDSLRDHFDIAWMLSPQEQIRQARLIARHEHHGRSFDEARSRALGSDEKNAHRVIHESQTNGVICVNPG